MVKLKFSIILVIITFVAINFSSCKKENNATANNISKGNRIKYNFNPDWKFIKENPKNAQESNFNDTSWSAISCPHTFNDIDTFDDLSHGHHNGEDNQWRGTVWYRKHFQLDKSDSEKKSIYRV